VHRRQEAAGLHHRAGDDVPAALRLVCVGADRHHVGAQVEAPGLDRQRVAGNHLTGVAQLTVDGQLDVLAADRAARGHGERLCVALRQVDLRNQRVDGRTDRARYRAARIGDGLFHVPEHRRVQRLHLVVAQGELTPEQTHITHHSFFRL